jgi:hypothetical protein
MSDNKKLHELWNIIAGLRLRSNEIHDRMNENEDKFVKSGNSELMRENFQLIEEQSEVSGKILELLSDYQNLIKESQ